jgi:hypothetical protein
MAMVDTLQGLADPGKLPQVQATGNPLVFYHDPYV